MQSFDLSNALRLRSPPSSPLRFAQDARSAPQDSTGTSQRGKLLSDSYFSTHTAQQAFGLFGEADGHLVYHVAAEGGRNR